jgi:G:T-mismatch repair DNA endonuclease (very short patch repair protein)
MQKTELLQQVRAEKGSISKTKLERVLRQENLLDEVLSKGFEDLHENFFWWFHSLTAYPVSCTVCAGPVKSFKNFDTGYSSFKTCSKKCSALEPRRQQQAKQTLISRYGVSHQMLHPATKDKVAKTLSDRYGVSNALQLPATREGMARKFGVEHISQSELWKSKTDKTFSERYGGRGFSGSLVSDIKKTLAEEIGVEPDSLSYHQLAAKVSSKRGILAAAESNDFTLVSFGGDSFKLRHRCGATRTLSFTDNNRWRCLECSPLKLSNFEHEVAEFLTKLGVTFETGDRKRISPLELDIYVAEKKLAIECNGDYWHSYDRKETLEERRKHLVKLERCQASGIQLIQVTEHEWQRRQEVVKSIIRVKLGLASRTFARKVEIRKITTSEANAFCAQHHIQGAAAASEAWGGYLAGELVMCLTVGKNRFTKSGTLELIRFATCINTVVVGGFSKLLQAVKDTHSGKSIESYLDRRLFDGHSLLSGGWKLVRTSDAGYCWLLGDVRISRNKTQKHRLEKLLGDTFDASKTEHENMFRAGARRLWDCGQHVFALEL